MQIVVFLRWILIACSSLAGPCLASANVTIVLPGASDFQTQLAAKELRRYLYLLSGELPALRSSAEPSVSGDQILLASSPEQLSGPARQAAVNSLTPQAFAIRSGGEDGKRWISIQGGGSQGLLYGSYRLLEHFGIRFHLHGDVIPERRKDFKILPLDLTERPAFKLRGLLPFHDFPEGADWWNAGNYKMHLTQMAKMRMNFIGLHCYPNVPWGPEPSVWMGLPEDVRKDGTVSRSYPASYHTTERLNGYGEDQGSSKRWWGYSALPTSQFSAGASELFERDNYGADCMSGPPYHQLSPDQANEVFNRTGQMFNEVFSYARKLGIKTALGTETPLELPGPLQEQLRQMQLDPASPEARAKVYEGMMTRLQRAHPLDFYWAWTAESWLNPVPRPLVERTLGEFDLAQKSIKNLGSPFQFATCGWAMGPAQQPTLFHQSLDRRIPISSITSWLGASRLDPGFADIEGRPKWAIPWLEDDTAMLSPQLWVGRLRRDAADAASFGCDGLMGIHWRTKILAPNIDLLASAGWSPPAEPGETTKRTTPRELPEGHSGGRTANYADAKIKGTKETPVYQTCRYALDYYRIKLPNGTYTLTLKFCEPHYREPGKRVFDVSVMGRPVAGNLDLIKAAGHHVAHDLVLENVKIKEGKLEIDFSSVVEFPLISGLVIEGRTADLNQIEGEAFERRINCGGGAWRGYEADLDFAPADQQDRGPRDLPAADYLAEWCRAEFGVAAADEVAGIFTELDSGGPEIAHSFESAWPRKMPLNNVWIKGPGGIRIDQRPWNQVAGEYAFVDKLRTIRSKIREPAARQRFDYWLDTFESMRLMGEIACRRAEYDALIAACANDPAAPKKALAMRSRLSRLWEQMMTHQLQAAATPGEFGTIANLEQHNRANLGVLDQHDEELEKQLGDPIPASAKVSGDYLGKPRLIVPAPRSVITRGETLRLKVILLSRQKARVVARWRPLGQGDFRELPVKSIGRGVKQVEFPVTDKDFEYYLEAYSGKKEPEPIAVFPVRGDQVPLTVVVAAER